MKGLLRAIIVIILTLTLSSSLAFAGFLDKINAAAQKLNEKSQQMQQNTRSGPPPGEDPDKPLHLEDYDKTGSCEGKRSATCMDYMELAGNCMAPLKGYRMKVTGDLIDKKLKREKLSDAQRKNLEEDLAAAREAEKNKLDQPTIAGEKNSQRYLQDISEEDQVYINAEYNKFYKKIYNKCMGADHMGIGKRTEMMQDTETMSGEEAVAAFRKKKKEEDAPFDCLAGLSTLRWTIMADKTEAKMNSMNLSDKDRKEWQEDIDLLRNIDPKSKSMPQSPDPKNPMRYMMRLDSNEQMALNQDVMEKTQELSTQCTAGTGKIKEREIKSGGLVDRSKSPANKNAKPDNKPRYDITGKGGGGGSLSASLGATNLMYMKGYTGCFAPLKGHFAKVHADFLEKKLKSAKGVSDEKRKEWEEDIAAWRAAEKAGVDQPTPPDPDNPYRWYDYVTNQERSQINKQHADFNNKIIKECGDKPSGL